jgi:hypothetical protein
MTELEIINIASKNIDKLENTREYNSCKLSYDSVISTTKAFVFNFNNLSQEEKVLFKSLHIYIKQLQKCMDSLKSQQVEKSEVKSKRSLISKIDKIENTEAPPILILEEVKENIVLNQEKKTKSKRKPVTINKS